MIKPTLLVNDVTLRGKKPRRGPLESDVSQLWQLGEAHRNNMASQPSAYNEERNLLRRRAWEQRIQETSQTKEFNPENVPLFGEPYKTNKGDELSNRIQRMLGSYEDVNIPCPFSLENLPIPTKSSQSDQNQTNEHKSTKTPFLNQDVHTSTQNGTSSNSFPSHPVRVPTAVSSPNHHKHFSPLSKTSLKHSSVTKFSSVQQQKESELFSDLRGCVGLHQEMPAQSSDAKPLNLLHSTDHNIDMDTRDTFVRHQLQGSTNYSSESASTMDASTLNIRHSPKDASLPQTKTNTLPSQTFTSLLSSKQSGTAMTQKPTAYVRPMDGQDQVVNESPNLKPSPEHYVPLPDVINNSDPLKTKSMPHYMETTEGLECVEDILREMTHSWPPLLTAIRTPRSTQPSQSPFPVKEAEQITLCPEQKNPDVSPVDLSHLNNQSSSVPVKAAHSSGAEMSSSTESESSRESDSESSTEETLQLPEGSLVKTEPDAPAVNYGDWQLVHFIRSSQQKSNADSSVSQSPSHKQLLPAQNSKLASGETSKTSTLSKLQPFSEQKKSDDDPPVPQRCKEIHQNNYLCQQSLKKSLSPEVGCFNNPLKLSKQATGGSDHTEAALDVKCEDFATTQTKKELCFPDRPKVKTKTGHRKKGSTDIKKDIKRTKCTKVVEKQKVESEVTPVLNGHCPLCGVSYPNTCSCPTQSPAQPAEPSSAPPIKTSCKKAKKETVQQSSNKVPPKSTFKHLEKSGNVAKASQNKSQLPRSLLVKIDLSLLAQVPQTSITHKGTPSSAKRPVVVLENHEEGGDAQNLTKTRKKAQNVEEGSKTLPKKKPKLDNKSISTPHASVKVENSTNLPGARAQKKAKKHVQDPATSKGASTNSKAHSHCSEKIRKSNKEAGKGKSLHNKKSGGKRTHNQKLQQNPSKSSCAVKITSQPIRPLLIFDERQYPVKYYIKEAKKLKHKADAETDKLSKAFNYLDAAMFFVESGIAIEKDPQISTSSYTMFAETVELLKFVLKLKNPADSSALPSEKDFLALCLKSQSLLQMAMFHHKQNTALNFSKTLTDHFNTSAQATQDPLSHMSSPARTSASSGPGSNQSASSLGVTIPQEIEKMVFSYVNITALFLSAHDLWDQAEEVAHRGSGLLAELDAVLSPLSLTSTMSSMIHYIRQGVHWLRLDSQKV